MPRNFWFGQFVKAAELKEAFTEALTRIGALPRRATLQGIEWGMVAAQHGVGDLTVDVTAGEGYVMDGSPIAPPATVNVDCSVDDDGIYTAVSTAGKHKCVTVYARHILTTSAARTDRTGRTIYWREIDDVEYSVVQGAETDLGDPLNYPAVPSDALPSPSDKVLVVDIELTYGMTQILTASLSTTRRQDVHVAIGSPYTLRRGKLRDALSDIMGWVNTAAGGLADFIAELASIGPGTAPDGASYIGAKARAGTALSLADGTVATQTEELRAAVDALKQECGASRSTAQIIPYVMSGDLVPLALDTEDYDTAAMFAPDETPGKDFVFGGGTFTCNGHGYEDGDAVHLVGADLPSDFDATHTYFVRDKTPNTFALCWYPGGTAITNGDAGTGTMKVHHTQTAATAPATGRYAVEGYATFEATATPGYRRLALLKNGTTVIGEVSLMVYGGNSLPISFAVGRTVPLSASDKVGLAVWHDAGSDYDVTVTAFSMKRTD